MEEDVTESSHKWLVKCNSDQHFEGNFEEQTKENQEKSGKCCPETLPRQGQVQRTRGKKVFTVRGTRRRHHGLAGAKRCLWEGVTGEWGRAGITQSFAGEGLGVVLIKCSC